MFKNFDLKLYGLSGMPIVSIMNYDSNWVVPYSANASPNVPLKHSKL